MRTHPRRGGHIGSLWRAERERSQLNRRGDEAGAIFGGCYSRDRRGNSSAAAESK